MVTEIHNDIKTWNPWQSKYNVMSFALLLLKIKYYTKTKISYDDVIIRNQCYYLTSKKIKKQKRITKW